MAAVSPAQPDPRITTLCGLAAVPNPLCFISRSLDAVTKPPPAARVLARDLSGSNGPGHHNMPIATRSAIGPRPPGPAGGPQPAPDPVEDDRHEPRIRSKVRGGPELALRVGLTGVRRRLGAMARPHRPSPRIAARARRSPSTIAIPPAAALPSSRT